MEACETRNKLILIAKVGDPTVVVNEALGITNVFGQVESIDSGLSEDLSAFPNDRYEELHGPTWVIPVDMARLCCFALEVKVESAFGARPRPGTTLMSKIDVIGLGQNLHLVH